MTTVVYGRVLNTVSTPCSSFVRILVFIFFKSINNKYETNRFVQYAHKMKNNENDRIRPVSLKRTIFWDHFNSYLSQFEVAAVSRRLHCELVINHYQNQQR